MAKVQKHTSIRVASVKPEQFKGDLLVLGCFKDAKVLPECYTSLDRTLKGELSTILKRGDFRGSLYETFLMYPKSAFPCPRILLMGLGEKKEFKEDSLRQVCGAAARKADSLGLARLGLALHGASGSLMDPDAAGQAVAEGILFGRYEYLDHKKPENGKGRFVPRMQAEVMEPNASAAAKLQKGCRRGSLIAEGQNIARALANRPGNEINPPSLAREAQKLARHFRLKCRILDDKQLQRKGMNGIVAVGGGSASKPRLIVLEYNGRRKTSKSAPDAVIVGKAVTFDSGGISIKPSAKMEEMKFDKSGGCAAIGILTAVAALKLPLHIIGLIPAAENLPSQTSYRPGDILTTYSGKTVEVQNTDAEGRMILCDALAYAVEQKPRAIVDMATLTGACVVALGEHYAGLFGNNDALLEQLKAAAKTAGEPVWHLPSGDKYLQQVKSDVADLKNTGGRDGGSCTAAAFLGEFVGKTPWAHIDIAGVANSDKSKAWRAAGATGFGVRLVLEYLLTL